MEHTVISTPLASQAGGRFLSLDQRDEIDKLVNQAKAISWLLGHAGEQQAEIPPAHRVNAAWALNDCLDRLVDIIEQGGRHD